MHQPTLPTSILASLSHCASHTFWSFVDLVCSFFKFYFWFNFIFMGFFGGRFGFILVFHYFTYNLFIWKVKTPQWSELSSVEFICVYITVPNKSPAHTVFTKYSEEAGETSRELGFRRRRQSLDVAASIQCVCFTKPETPFPLLFPSWSRLRELIHKNKTHVSDCLFV